MAGRLHVSGREFPVTPQLVYALALGFAVFNQALLLVLALALLREERAGAAAVFGTVAAVLGVVVLAGAAAWQWRARWMRATDAAAFAAAGLPAAFALYCLVNDEPVRGAAAALAAGGLAMAWQSRGLVRRRVARMLRKTPG